MERSNTKIGVMVPYSGEFPGLKSTLTQPFKVHSRENGYELFIEYINQGDAKTVEKAINKLCYQEEVEVVTGYIASHIADSMAVHFHRYSSCLFMPCTIGEVIYVQRDTYPQNYKPISYKAWQLQVLLGSMVGSYLQPKTCMVATSVYDCGYSLHECFRIGLQGVHPIETVSSILKEEPGKVNAAPLVEEIKRLRPAHIYVLLCGKTLTHFLQLFDKDVDYEPTLSFAFPVNRDGLPLSHPSFLKCYTTYNNISRHPVQQVLSNPFGHIFNAMAQKAINLLAGLEFTDHDMLVEMDLVNKTATEPAISYQYADVREALMEASAAIPAWQNPYLCI